MQLNKFPEMVVSMSVFTTWAVALNIDLSAHSGPHVLVWHYKS